jgi:hypothetical protein
MLPHPELVLEVAHAQALVDALRGGSTAAHATTSGQHLNEALLDSPFLPLARCTCASKRGWFTQGRPCALTVCSHLPHARRRSCHRDPQGRDHLRDRARQPGAGQRLLSDAKLRARARPLCVHLLAPTTDN